MTISPWRVPLALSATDPEVDPTLDHLKATVEPSDQRPLYRELSRLFTDDLPVLALYFTVDISIARAGITGIKGRSKPAGDPTWNIAEWTR